MFMLGVSSGMPHGIRGLRSHREVSVVLIIQCIIGVMSADWEMIRECSILFSGLRSPDICIN